LSYRTIYFNYNPNPPIAIGAETLPPKSGMRYHPKLQDRFFRLQIYDEISLYKI